MRLLEANIFVSVDLMLYEMNLSCHISKVSENVVAFQRRKLYYIIMEEKIIFWPNVSPNKVNNIPGWKNLNVFIWLFIGFPYPEVAERVKA